MSPEQLAGMRHSLRTPLNHIVGYAEMVRDEARGRGDAESAHAMQQIAGLARRIVELIQNELSPDAEEHDRSVRELRQAILPLVEQILTGVQKTSVAIIETCRADIGRIHAAALELLEFARGGEWREPSVARALREGSGMLPAAGEPERPPARILVVDDDAANRELLCRILQKEGFATGDASNGSAALELLAGGNFDLALLDIYMPGMDGLQTLAQAKSHPALRNIPILVLSASDDPETAVRSICMGAEDFVARPFDAVLLRARVGAILRRRSAEADRAQLAEYLQLLLESTGEGVYGLDREGRCTFINRAALDMLGYTREEFLGRNIHHLAHHSRADGSPYPEEECPTYSVLRTGKPRRCADECLFRADGSSFPVEYSAHPVTRGGEIDGVVVTFSDISERVRSEKRLVQSAKLESLGVMAGGIAHDFNNILTGILGNASLAADSMTPSDPNYELLREVVTASERAADLTRQMLAFAGKGQFDLEPLDISATIEEMAGLIEVALPKPVRVSLQLARNLAPVHGDARQIQQLVLNLALNAGEAIGERPGLVIIETGMRELPEGIHAEPPFERIPPGRYVFVSVRDTGSGMDAATRSRIFDPFFTTKFTGRGLGLPAAMGIVRAHRGGIRLETEPGRGSVFEVLLPVEERHAAASNRRGAVLVVDDEDVVRRTTRAVLERNGYRVMLAENGQQGIEMLRRNGDEIALVLLDLTMPVMGGDEAARFMHAICPDVPILVSSGYKESEVARRFAGSRVAGFVRKPYTSAALSEKIAVALGKKP